MLSHWRSHVRQACQLTVTTGLWMLVWVGMTLLITSIGLHLFFGKITIDQLLFNVIALRADGAGGALFWLGIVGIGVVPAMLTWLLAYVHRLPRRSPRATRTRVSPMRVTAILLAASVTVLGTTAFVSTVKLADYVRAAEVTRDLGDFYHAPVVRHDEKPRNLILVYLESVETALGDATLFGDDMLAPVTEATAGWERIDSLRQYPGGGWTMAGLVATQCGIPLKGKIEAEGSQIVRELVTGLEHYLPGVQCLGDVLAEHGYTNVFLGGADARFAAKDVFLAEHGYERIKDLTDWRAAGEASSDIRSDWGLSDARLMELARAEVEALSAESERTGRPFHLSVLTLDTHEPPHRYDSCAVEASHEMAEVYLCSLTAVAEFIDWLSAEGHLDDTAVVVMGDHLKQLGTTSSFTDELDGQESRTIFNRIWVPGDEPARELLDDIDQLSMYPTILEIAGFTVQDDVAGVGVSAYATSVPEDSAPALDRSAYHEVLHARSTEFYRAVWTDE